MGDLNFGSENPISGSVSSLAEEEFPLGTKSPLPSDVGLGKIKSISSSHLFLLAGLNGEAAATLKPPPPPAILRTKPGLINIFFVILIKREAVKSKVFFSSK